MNIFNKITSVVNMVGITFSKRYASNVAKSFWSKTKVTHGSMDESNFDFYAKELIKLIGNVKGLRILDYGAGGGQISKRFTQAGAEVHAVEFVEHFIQDIQNLGIKAFLPNEIPENTKYDVIVMNNAFFYVHPKEHLELLKWFHSHLSANGRLLLTDVPDFEKRHILYNSGIQQRILLWLTSYLPVYQPELSGFFIDFNKLINISNKVGFSKSESIDSWCDYRSHLISTK